MLPNIDAPVALRPPPDQHRVRAARVCLSSQCIDHAIPPRPFQGKSPTVPTGFNQESVSNPSVEPDETVPASRGGGLARSGPNSGTSSGEWREAASTLPDRFDRRSASARALRLFMKRIPTTAAIIVGMGGVLSEAKLPSSCNASLELPQRQPTSIPDAGDIG